MRRPALTPQIALSDFKSFYWLKEELIAFCRKNGLPTAGSKADLSARIEQLLATGHISPLPATESRRKAPTALPDQLSRDTVIGPHWRCSEPLRAFFVEEIGPQFHFNGVMRTFIQQGAGKTLQEAIDAWHADRAAPKAETKIDSQFEYNQHIRAFFKENPGKTLADAIQAWKKKRAQRRPG
jgi:hypothetical protein